LFPITQQFDNLPPLARSDVDIVASGDNDDPVDKSRKFKDILQKATIISTTQLRIFIYFKFMVIVVCIYSNSITSLKNWFTICDFACQSASAYK